MANALATPPVPPKSWQDGVAPAFISLLMSVVFLDQVAVGTLFVGGLGPAVVGASLGGLLAYWMLYYAPAMWGHASRRPLAVVASSTFGARGAAWVPGLVLGLAHVAWFAIAIDFATDYGLRSLVSCGLLDARHVPTSIDGRIGRPGPLFLGVAIAWSLSSALIGTLAIRLVAAVMAVYPIFPALALGATVFWALPSVALGPVEAVPMAQGGGRSVATMIQMVFCFLATYGLTAADWGAASRAPRDVRLGGLVGVTLATPILACLAMLIVAGAIGREKPAPTPEPAPTVARPSAKLPRKASSKSPNPRSPRKPAAASEIREEPRADPNPILTLRDVYSRSIGGRAGTAAFLVLALALLGPACYSPFGIARQFLDVWPRVHRWQWSMAGSVATWPLLASGLAGRIDLLFPLVGAITAPAAGAIAADYFRQRGRWEGPSRGVNLAGMAAWFVGTIVGLFPWIGKFARLGAWSQSQPAAVFGFLAAFVAYLLLASIGLEPARLKLDEKPS